MLAGIGRRAWRALRGSLIALLTAWPAVPVLAQHDTLPATRVGTDTTQVVDFPRRDLLFTMKYGVVIQSLLVQGLTSRPSRTQVSIP